MTIVTPQPVGQSQFTPFLAHAGARLGYFADPPGPSVVVEPGRFQGIDYDGVVLTPSVASSGAARIDLIVANPIADGGPAIELVEGTEGEAAPSLDDLPGRAAIAEVVVTGHSSGVSVITRDDITDLRPILHLPQPSYKLLFIGRVRLGNGMQRTVGSTQLLGDDEAYPFEEVLTVKRVGFNQRVPALPGHRFDRVDLEMPYYVEDFHLVGGPYDTMIGAQMEQDRGNMGVGLTWKLQPSETQDSEGRDLPLIRIASAGSSGKRQGEGPSYFTGDQGARRQYAFYHFQAWGRV